MDIDNQTIVIPQTYKRYNGKLYSTIGISKPDDTIYLESKKKFVRLMEFNNKKEYL